MNSEDRFEENANLPKIFTPYCIIQSDIPLSNLSTNLLSLFEAKKALQIYLSSLYNNDTFIFFNNLCRIFHLFDAYDH